MDKPIKPKVRSLDRQSVTSYVNVEELPINQPKSPELLAYYDDAKNVSKRKHFRKALNPQEIEEVMHKYVRGTLWYNEETKIEELYYPTYNDLANEYGVSMATLQKYGKDGEWGLLKKAIRMNMNRVHDEEVLKDLLINVKAMESRQLSSANKLHEKLDEMIDRIDVDNDPIKDVAQTIKQSMETLIKINDLQEKIIKKEQLQDDIRDQFKALAEEKQRLKEQRKKRGRTLIRKPFNPAMEGDDDMDDLTRSIEAKKQELRALLIDEEDLPIRI